MVRILEIETYAHENNIPIMMKDGIEFLCEYIKNNNVKKILEIGTAIGYSAIKMALVNEEIKVTTIERDKVRYDLAIKNINDFELGERINVIFSDAFEVELNDKYDLIFIDAAKSQYIKFFLKYQENLTKNGIIVSDNLDFHGLVKSEKFIESRNVRGIVRKLRSYIEFLQTNSSFKTEFYEIGDGIAISKRTYE